MTLCADRKTRNKKLTKFKELSPTFNIFRHDSKQIDKLVSTGTIFKIRCSILNQFFSERSLFNYDFESLSQFCRFILISKVRRLSSRFAFRHEVFPI